MMLTQAEQNLLEMAPEGANCFINGKLVRGTMTPAMAAIIEARANIKALGDDVTEEQIDALLAPVREAMGGAA